MSSCYNAKMRTTGLIETTFGENGTNVEIAFTLENQGNRGTPLAFVHGWGCSRRDFEGAAIAPELDDRPCLSFDLPGHGDSSTISDAVTVEGVAEILHDVTSVAGLGYYALVGHSVGGLIAIKHLLRYPDRIAGLINVVGNMRSEDCFLTENVANGIVTVDELIERFRGSTNPGFRRYAEGLARVDKSAYTSLAASAVDACSDGSAYRHFVTADLGLPRVFMFGSETRDTLPYLDDLYDSSLVSVHEVPNADHFPAVDNPVNFYRAVGDFMRRIDS